MTCCTGVPGAVCDVGADAATGADAGCVTVRVDTGDVGVAVVVGSVDPADAVVNAASKVVAGDPSPSDPSVAGAPAVTVVAAALVESAVATAGRVAVVAGVMVAGVLGVPDTVGVFVALGVVVVLGVVDVLGVVVMAAAAAMVGIVAVAVVAVAGVAVAVVAAADVAVSAGAVPAGTVTLTPDERCSGVGAAGRSCALATPSSAALPAVGVVQRPASGVAGSRAGCGLAPDEGAVPFGAAPETAGVVPPASAVSWPALAACGSPVSNAPTALPPEAAAVCPAAVRNTGGSVEGPVAPVTVGVGEPC